MTAPSGAGQTDKAHSMSIVPASDADPMPVGLAPGAASAANQPTELASLASIDGKLTAPQGPNRGVNLWSVAVTASSVHTDLTPGTQLIADIAVGKEFVLTADGGDIWYFFSQSTGGHSVSATIASLALGTTVPAYLPAGQSTPPMIIPAGTQGVVALASNATTMLRIQRIN